MAFQLRCGRAALLRDCHAFDNLNGGPNRAQARDVIMTRMQVCEMGERRGAIERKSKFIAQRDLTQMARGVARAGAGAVRLGEKTQRCGFATLLVHNLRWGDSLALAVGRDFGLC